MARGFSSLLASELLGASLVGGSLLGTVGCVERLFEVRSDPPGASVHLNGKEAGTTPLDHEFTYYGTYDVTLRAPGHYSHKELKVISPPWYEVFPLDFFSEIVIPWKLEDVHTLEVRLVPLSAQLDDTHLDAERKDLEAKAAEIQGQPAPPATGEGQGSKK